MNGEDQIKWATITLNFSDEQEALLEKLAQAAGLSIKCYCLDVICKHVLRDVPADRMENLQAKLALMLNRNGCG